MKFVSAAAATLMLAGAASAHAATWTVDAAKSHLGFTGSQSGTPFAGHFGKFDGTIVFDPANPAAGHADITIDTASAATGDQQKDSAMPGADWFSVAAFPQAHFVATGFKSTGAGNYAAAGTLTIRGVSKPVTLPFTLAISGDQATAAGKVQLVRTAFGVGQGAWATAQYVGLDVAVDFAIVAGKTAP
jgi:polyisoprenoid-binding protein YceI